MTLTMENSNTAGTFRRAAGNIMGTYGEQGGKLQPSLQCHLQLSRRRQRQPALEGHAHTVTAVLQGENERK